MSMCQLAWQNVKSGLKNYLSLILSQAFTILIFLNFQNVVYSDALTAFGEHNKDYSDMLVQTVSVVLGVFMVFFIGYATNVFLTRRKKEIGIYVFMGLTNQKIGRLYMLEMAMVGMLTLILGIVSGILTTQLFQMVLLAISDIAIDAGFHFSLRPVCITSAFYVAVYLFFVVKGYVNIVKSSILNLISAGRQNEYVRQSTGILVFKTALGAVILSAGYYLAVKEGGQEVINNVLTAVVLVIVGVYFVFGGLIPVLFQGLAKNKVFLYRKERTLWVNQVIFRMKKNYRTYAMVCILMLCSVTALATSFALKSRYQGMVDFRNMYTYQLLSSQPDLDKKALDLIEQDNEIDYSAWLPVLMAAGQDSEEWGQKGTLAVVSWPRVKALAKEAGLEFDIEQPGPSQVVELDHLNLLSLYTKHSEVPVEICGKTYAKTEEVKEPYLGYLQEQMSFYMVNGEEYERLLPQGQELYAYNYRIKDIYHYEASVEALGTLVSNTDENYTARIVTGPQSSEQDIGWVKILYSLCVFMVMVFILASGSILFMKLYNDAFEEKGRYAVLQKMGYPYKTLKRSAARELMAAYALPFAVMAVSSYFSVHALEKMMYTDLTWIRLMSVGIIFLFFFLCYRVSVRVYLKNAGVR